MFKDQIRNLYGTNLNIKKEEILLIFTDTEKEYLVDLMEEFRDVGEELAKEVRYLIYPSTGVHGKEPPEELWRLVFGDEAIDELIRRDLFRKILEKDPFPQEEAISVLREKAGDVPQAVVAFPYYSTTHTFFRKVLTEEFGSRYASMPLFDPTMFLTSMDVDWEFVSRLSGEIADVLTEAESRRLREPSGG